LHQLLQLGVAVHLAAQKAVHGAEVAADQRVARGRIALAPAPQQRCVVLGLRALLAAGERVVAQRRAVYVLLARRPARIDQRWHRSPPSSYVV
jgi:hypothetical protein